MSRLLILTIIGVLAACGGPAKGPNQPPTAAFTAGDSVQAGTPLAFDASTSSDPDQDPLSFSWEFGDGVRGGAARIAHIFGEAGTFTVKLTVGDGRGGTNSTEKTVTVTPGPAPSKTVSTLAFVTDSSGNPLSGVSVSGAGGSATTDTSGKASVPGVGVGVPVTLKFSKAGFADQFKVLELPASAESGYVEARLMPREPAQNLDAGTGGSLTGKQGAKLTLPAGALVDGSGNPVSGAVQVNISPVDVGTNLEAFPGRFQGVGPTGQQGFILSYGTVEYALSKGGQPLNVAPGKSAVIEIPVYTSLNRDGSQVKVGDKYPLWSLNEKTGKWVQEGEGTVVASSASPTGLALRGEVTHFSWWNHDQFDGPPYNPKPKCLVDTDHDGNLEDLTGTGFCWHYGTGPDQPPQFGGARVGRSATAPHIPAVAAEGSTPVGGGQVLPIPADLDITFRSYAKNGTLAGLTVLRGPAGKEEDVTIVLYPVGNGGSCDAPPNLSVPHDKIYSFARTGETQCFNLSATAAQSFEVRVSRATGSTLTGTVRVIKPGGSADQTDFGAQVGSVVVANAAAGVHRLEVKAGANAPGGYRLELRPLTGSTCTNPPSLALPHDQTYNYNASTTVQCFNVALSPGEALEARLPSFSPGGVQGLFRVYAPDGQKIAEDAFGGTFSTGLLIFGAAQGGEHRLEVVFTNASSGNFRLTASKSTPEVLGVPDSRTVSGTAVGGRVRYLLNAPPGSPVGLILTAQNGQHGVAAYPSGAFIYASCQSCAQPGTEAFVQKTPPSARMVLEVFRNNGSSTSQFTLATRTPTPIALDTDVNTTLQAGQLDLYTFEGSEGQEVSLGIAYAQSAVNFLPGFRLLGPDGGTVNNGAQSGISTLPKSGIYGLVVRSGFPGSGAYTLRLNAAKPPQPLTLQDPLTEVSTGLALGERRRYTLSPNLAQAEVFALKLTTTQTSYATALVSGPAGGVYDALVNIDSGGGAQTKVSNGIYVRTAGAYTLELYSTERYQERLGGTLTVGLVKPTPQPASLETAQNGTLGLGQMAAYRYNLPAEGRYLLRATFSSPTCCLYATVWAPSTPFSNYTGEFTASNSSFSEEAKGLLKAGTHTLTLLNPINPSNTNFTARLVTLDPPTDLTPGGPAQNGTIDVAERDYYRFTAGADQNFTVSVSGGFSGTVRVYPLPPNGDYTAGGNLTEFNPPKAFGSHNFTTPTAGTYILEIDGSGEASGSYSVSLSSP
ncbi:PKD domain-containing protein [Meiothermus sp.]|uniref:PKD domain-containing protein n=1 Tax=Meiothermus sp. TaxID=1955249 RepID=UPI00307D2CA1